MFQPNFFKFRYFLAAVLFLILCFTPLIFFHLYPATSAPASTAVTPPTPKPALSICLVDESSAYLTTDLPVYDRLLVSQREAQKLPTALPKLTPYYGKKTVYLTFDDGPDPKNTPYVLDLLKEYHIHATFFLVGKQAEKYPDLVKRIFDEGHAIGNHSYNHNYRDLYRSPQTYLAQLHHTDEIIQQIIGVRPRISRAPGGTVGNFRKDYWTLLKSEGYRDISWNISSGDASDGKAADLIDNVTDQMQRTALQSHSIVLMHDGPGHAETMKALRQIIDLFRSQGYEFKVVNMRTPDAW